MTSEDIFGVDKGTMVTTNDDSTNSLIDISSLTTRQVKKLIRNSAGDQPVVWFVDDQRASREWFRNTIQAISWSLHLAQEIFSNDVKEKDSL